MDKEAVKEKIIDEDELDGLLEEAKGESTEPEVELVKEESKESEIELELEPGKQEKVEVEPGVELEVKDEGIELELELESEIKHQETKEEKEKVVLRTGTDLSIMVQDIQAIADVLYSVVEKQHLYQEIRGKKYLQLEAWQTLGKFCNVVGKIEWVKPVSLWNAKGFEAMATIQEITVSVDESGKTHRKLGAVIASVESMCMDDEQNWKDKPMFQLKSMAQTRALSKAYRSCLSFIVALAGYAPTPLEEISE